METSNQVKSAFLWLLIAVGLIFHSVFALDGVFFGASLQLPDTDGTEPPMFTVMHILFEVLPLVFVLLSLFVRSRCFLWVSCIWASLMCLGNAMHLVLTFGEEPFSIAQIILLSFVLSTNVMLVITLYKSLKHKSFVCCDE